MTIATPTLPVNSPPDTGEVEVTGMEKYYMAVRQKEGRLYSDEQVLLLPEIARRHPLYGEWQARKESAARLKHYIEKKTSLPHILEVGCGNGWLCRQLAQIPGCSVTGVDINFSELQQATRVFSHIPRLRFIHGGIQHNAIADGKYDFIVFAAAIHYFPSLKNSISEAECLLKPGGEIHILDSHFYKPADVNAAKERTVAYYHQLGFPEMAALYYHHSTDDMNEFHYRTLYKPSLWGRYILNHQNPFPWYYIKKT